MQRYLSFFKNLRHHKRRILFILIPVIILAFIFWPKPPKPIETQTVKIADITESLSATGNVDATSVNLTFLTGGKLAYLGVKKGDAVKEGQVIATLDQRTVQKNLEIQMRAYAKERDAFEKTKNDNHDHTPANALSDDMRRILQNSQYDLEDAVASVELQDLAKQQSVLISPIAGVVTRADVDTAGINIGATTTFTVADLSESTFNIDIDEADIAKVKVGQQVNILLDAYPDKTITVPVKSIDFASHTTSTGGTVYTVEIILPAQTALQYRIGMNGDAEIITNEKKHVLTAPLSSIVDDKFVYVKNKNNFEKRTVKLGLHNDTDAEIASGLNAGEEVAIDPTEAEKMVKK